VVAGGVIMHRILSGAISAPFHADGSHLDYHLSRQTAIASKLCEELILHDQITVPCPDFLTAVGLAHVIGERGLIELLEEGRLQFIRMQGTMVYMRGNGPDGALLTMVDPDGRIANSAELPRAIELGLQAAQGRVQDVAKLRSLLETHSVNEDARFVVASAAHATYQDFRQSRHWRKFYADLDPEKLRLASVAKSSGRVLGAKARQDDPMYILLSMAQNNIELHLAQKYECDSTSTSSPLGESIELKIARLTESKLAHQGLWRLFEVNGIPDISAALLNNKDGFAKFITLTRQQNVQDFRDWFHTVVQKDGADVVKEYVAILKSVPSVSTIPMKVIRFLVTTALGVNPLVGAAAGFLDSFVVEKILKGKSPKYFVDDLAAFHGKVRK
jgi:hypothetical protein